MRLLSSFLCASFLLFMSMMSHMTITSVVSAPHGGTLLIEEVHPEFARMDVEVDPAHQHVHSHISMQEQTTFTSAKAEAESESVKTVSVASATGRLRVKDHWKVSGYAYVSAAGQWSFSNTPVPDQTPVAEASFEDSLPSTGWDVLKLKTTASFPDPQQAYAAGYLEGRLTASRIYELVDAIVYKKKKNDDFINFLNKQDAWLRANVQKEANEKAAAGTPGNYWYLVSLVLSQLDGLLAGTNAALQGKQVSLLDLWQINDDGDLLDIERAVASNKRLQVSAKKAKTKKVKQIKPKVIKAKTVKKLKNNVKLVPKKSKSTSKPKLVKSKLIVPTIIAPKVDDHVVIVGAPRFKAVDDMSRTELLEMIAFNGHCSALIKWTGDDLLVGHATWADYEELMRVYKHITLNFNHPSIKSKHTSMSSYPGFLWSSDDWYMLDSGLLVLETTLNILNDSLYSLVGPEKGVMAWIRSLLANRISSSAAEWANNFSKYNSGTYNNQWLIVDYNKFQKEASQLSAGTFLLLEQIPGHIETRDMTSVLQSQTYWASYNLPFFATTNTKSMYAKFAKKHGEMLSYGKSSRAKIFAREQKKVKTLEDMKRVLRHNDYLHDPVSKGCPGEAIAARHDLPPKKGAKCDITKIKLNGATDAKVTSAELFRQQAAYAIGGPSSDSLPAFTWVQHPQEAKKKPPSQPNTWNFGWTEQKP